MIDLVITYVDCYDKSWRHDYLVYSRIEKKVFDINNVRFRSWNNFNYILRSIAQYMPFIDNLYLIVAKETQIPKFINLNTVKVIYHKDIIPTQYLPTFNSNTIEMFMYRIPGLSENFIYMNDDMLFLKEYKISDFYDDDMNPLVMIHEKEKNKDNIYTKSLRNTQALTNKENPNFKLVKENSILRSDHAPNPMKISMWKYYWEKYNEDLSNSLSKFRESKNITQELLNYHYYMYYVTNNIKCFGNRKSKYFDFVNRTSKDLEKILFDKNITSTCINDAGVKDFRIYRDVTNKLLAKRFPDKCKYEL